MQASASRASVGLLLKNVSAPRLLPPCTCGALPRIRKSSSIAARAESQTEPVASSVTRQRNSIRRLYTGRSQAERLAERETRKAVLLEGLTPWVTPNDVRRLIAQRMGHARDVTEVVLLPHADLKPAGRALVEFTWAVKAKEAVDKLKGKQSAGLAEEYLDCRLADISRKPYPQLLSHRNPLAARSLPYDAFSQAPPNLKAGLQYSGRAVVLSGFPRTIHPLTILERLHKEGFYPVKASGTSTGWSTMDEIVHLKSHYLEREEKFVNYLVRLPSKAEAHRLAASWNATWPKGAMMNGEVRINADVVW